MRYFLMPFKWFYNFYVKIVIAPILLFILMYDDQKQNWHWDCQLSEKLGLPITPWEEFYEPFWTKRVPDYFKWRIYEL